MSDHVASSTGRHRAWADLVVDHYHLRLDAALTDWFDSEQWRSTGTGEFSEPVTPEQLLADCPEPIWPGLMPPDLLPLVGDQYGDWLCLRVAADNSVQEIVHWYHGGGDWIPWGQTLPEAFAFQQTRDHLPGLPFRHADPAAPLRTSQADDPHFLWAKRFLPLAAVQLIEGLAAGAVSQPSLYVIEQLIGSEVATTALHAEAILQALDTPLRRLTPAQANELGIVWDGELDGWLLDAAVAPPDALQRLATRLHQEVSQLKQQDWDTAAQHASAVASTRGDLSWPLHILAWTAERRREPGAALESYGRALTTSVFTDQSVRFRTHNRQEEKRSATRLAQLLKQHPELGDEWHGDREYWQVWSTATAADRQTAIAQLWQQRASSAEAGGHWQTAYEAYVQAGWDLGLTSMLAYGPLLRHIADAAERAGQPARAAVAAAHARCFAQRFG